MPESESLIGPDLVRLDAALGSTKAEVSAQLAEIVTSAGRATDTAGLIADIQARESQAPTGLPGGIGIPHCRSEHVVAPTLAFARLSPAVDFGAPDGPADLIFLIAAPAGGGGDHMTLLTSLARALVRPEFTSSLRSASTAEEVVGLVEDAVAPKPAATPAPAADSATVPAGAAATTAGPAAAAAPTEAAPTGESAAVDVKDVTLVAITACPTGIAHTFMAAESLEAAAARAGVTLHVEPQGSTGAPPLAASIVSSADAVIFATDVGVRNRERFAGKPVITSGVKRAINDADAMIAEAVAASRNPSASRVQGDASQAGQAQESGDGQHFGLKLRQWLLTGVSYMIPFVAAGGLLIALGYLLGGYPVQFVADNILATFSITNLPDLDTVAAFTGPDGSALLTGDQAGELTGNGLLLFLGAALFKLGGLAFGFLVPALAGYIAFGMADRPGLAPGFTMGALAGFIGAGFLGGLVGGLLAGGLALWISRWKVPSWMRGLMPVVIIPLLATLIGGAVLLFVLGRPLALVTEGLSEWLGGLAGGSAIVLGIILGLMMAFDLGGPVNKAAYTFATAGLAAASTGNGGPLRIMAAVMAAGMVPPLALALATALRGKLFSAVERENGKAAWLLGASFISEGAIPFAAADPLRIIPPLMVGSAATGAIVMASGVTLRAPHGGIFVFFAMGNVLMFVLAIVVGMVIGAAGVLIAKRIGRPADRVAAA